MSGTATFQNNYNLANLTAPASGTTHAAKFIVNVSGNTATLQMSGFVQQLGDFQGQAMTVDNSGSALPVTISETRYGWSRIVQAGATQTFQYPAVADQVFTVYCSGTATVPISIYDWPAFPEWASLSGTGSQPVSVVGTVAVTQSGAWSVSTTNTGTTGTDRGGTITTGGTAQTLAAANAARRALVIQNPPTAAAQGIAAAEALFVRLTSGATINGANFACLQPGDSLSLAFAGLVDTELVSVNASTTGHRFYATEF